MKQGTAQIQRSSFAVRADATRKFSTRDSGSRRRPISFRFKEVHIQFGVPDVFNYFVSVSEDRCTCDRYRNARPRLRCEHIWGVFYYIDPPTADEFELPAERAADPQPTTAFDKPKPSSQLLRAADIQSVLGGGWSRFRAAYERALQNEFTDVMDLALVVFKQYAGDALWRPRTGSPQGRRSFPLWLMLFADFTRIFNGFTLRGTQGFLDFLVRVGYLDVSAPQFNAIGAFARNQATSGILDDLIFLSASPFRSVGKIRVVSDGTGWSSSKYGDHRLEHRDAKEEAREHDWWRATLISDPDGMFILSASVTAEDIGEKASLRRMLPNLVERGWDIGPFLLDAGFDDTILRDDLIDLGFDPYIPYRDGRVNAIPPKHRRTVKHPEKLITCFHVFSQYEAQFRPHFRFRVKVECLIAALKERFGSFAVRTERLARATIFS